MLILLPLLGLVGLLAVRRRRKAIARLGMLSALHALTHRRSGWQTLRGLCVFAGLGLLTLGVAGPQWGRDYEQAVATGRDLVVLLDLSRSMLAQDVLPSRLGRAKQALIELSYALQQRGGHRLGLVVFVASAKIVCPLTHDYDHFRRAVEGQDAANLPLEFRPKARGPTSGTRMGAGLKMAVQAHRSGAPGPGVILMLSDGDDPARDEEWREGALEAKGNQIPVFTVGLGDPKPKYPVRIPLGNDVLRHNDVPVETKLEEKPLEEIARLTRGTYIAARTGAFNLGALFKDWVEQHELRTEAAETFPSYVQRYDWFFGAALVLLGASTLIGHRRAVVTPAEDQPPALPAPADGDEMGPPFGGSRQSATELESVLD
jgi:Ca-activated chloride channel family protein